MYSCSASNPDQNIPDLCNINMKSIKNPRNKTNSEKLIYQNVYSPNLKKFAVSNTVDTLQRTSIAGSIDKALEKYIVSLYVKINFMFYNRVIYRGKRVCPFSRVWCNIEPQLYKRVLPAERL